jgi:hypothetical protein
MTTQPASGLENDQVIPALYSQAEGRNLLKLPMLVDKMKTTTAWFQDSALQVGVEAGMGRMKREMAG